MFRLPCSIFHVPSSFIANTTWNGMAVSHRSRNGTNKYTTTKQTSNQSKTKQNKTCNIDKNAQDNKKKKIPSLYPLPSHCNLSRRHGGFTYPTLGTGGPLFVGRDRSDSLVGRSVCWSVGNRPALLCRTHGRVMSMVFFSLLCASVWVWYGRGCGWVGWVGLQFPALGENRELHFCDLRFAMRL